MDLKRLADYFPESEIEWKPITISKKTGKALAAAYITNRAIMDRLDEVCGPVNWKNEFQPGPDGGVICGISIRVPTEEGGTEWVCKWDGSENTDVEAVKGGLSTAMRRAAVQWGIGRYLYSLPSQWVPVDEYGHFTKTPSIPRGFLPTKTPRPSPANGKPIGEVTSPVEPVTANYPEIIQEILIEAEVAGISSIDVLRVAGTEYGCTRLDELTDDQAQALLTRLKTKTSHG